jgi:hypothetical protein
MRVPVAPQTDFVPGPRPARISCAQEVRRERRRLAGFLVAEGVDDWVVLHGGATPVFKVGSIAEAARLAAAVAEIDGFGGHCPWPLSVAVSKSAEVGGRSTD